MLRMSDPSRFVSGIQGSATGEPDVVLRAVLEHIEEQTRLLKRMQRRQRMKLDTALSRLAYATSASNAEFTGGTADTFRVTYIYAFISGAAVGGTLHLKGGQSGDTFAIPIPNASQPPLILPLGDDETGGILLDRNDTPRITTADGSSQLIVGILAGEIMQDSFLTQE